MIQAGTKALRGKLIIKAVLRLESGLHIGGSSDFAPIGAVDSPFIRDPYTKRPIVPGSSIKGKLRTLIARSLTDSYILNDIAKDDDSVKRLFGSSNKDEFHASRLLFPDVKLSKSSFERYRSMDTDTYFGEVKFENSINRVTAVANPRQIERVPAGTEFDFTVVYNVENIDEITEDIEMLSNGLMLLQMDYLGGHGSRGYGRVSFSKFDVDVVSINAESSKKIYALKEDVKELLQGVEGCAL